MNAKVVISIVTYNSGKIFEVLDNICDEFQGDDRFRFVIFDNNSEDAYKKKLQKYTDTIQITFYHKNNGFGFGHNYNLMDASEPYFLVFNPDIILKKQDLLQMLDLFEKEDDIALVVPKVLNADLTTQHLVRNRVSVFDYMLRFIPFSFMKTLFQKRLHSYECRDLRDDCNTDVRIGSGCFMLLTGSYFKQVNGFDDRYFMYFEDYDLCLKFGQIGKRIVYTPFSTVVHYYERGAHKNLKLFKIFMHSMYKFFNKWGWKWM